jgi:RNA polymerase II subunit A small phosphatase-like protein
MESACLIQTKPLLPPSKSPGKKTLVLDLDETLVHSSFVQEPQSKFAISLSIEGRPVRIYVNIRPGVPQFLERVADLYEVVVFTASLSAYADPLLDQIDTRGLISARLFRESCLFENGTYVKDLSMLGRDLKQVLIVDVSAN